MLAAGYKDKQLYRSAVIFNANLEYHGDSFLFFYLDYKMELCAQNVLSHPQLNTVPAFSNFSVLKKFIFVTDMSGW